MASYSGTPLAKKLGIKPGSNVFVEGAPLAYDQLLAPMPADVSLQSAVDSSTDVVHLFCAQRDKFVEALEKSLPRLRPDAAIWVSWPKKASKVSTDLTENAIRDLALPLGLVDIKVCAVNDVWSGLKLVLRKEHRPSSSSGTRRQAGRKRGSSSKT